MTPTIRRLLTLAAVVAVMLAGTGAGLALAASRAIPTPLRTLPTVHRLTALAHPSRVAVAPRALPGGELPRDWQDHGTWWPAIGQRGAQTTQVALYLGPTAGWLPCQYRPSGVSVAGRPMTYRCAASAGSAAGAITLVAPLVHTATGWWEQAATDSTADAGRYQVFRVAGLTRASNGHPWYVTTRRQRVRLQAPPPAPPVPTLGLRPVSQRVPAGHPAGVTVTGANWPAGAYAVLWNFTNNVDLTPTAHNWCPAPDCQWMLTAPSRPGTYLYGVYLHARSGARLATAWDPALGRPANATVTWYPMSPGPTPTPTPTLPPAATPTPTPGVTPTSTPTPTPPPPSSTVVSSTNWSGYIVGNGPYTSASGTFNVPNLYAATTQTDTSEWVGIDGSTDNSLVQTGVSEIYDPSTNLVNFQPWWTLSTYNFVGQPINMAVSPGNTMTATVSEVSPGLWDLTLTNDTTGATFTTDQSYSAPLASAEWIVEDPGDPASGGLYPFGDYSPAVTFTNDRFSGVEATLQEDIMLQNGAQVSTPSNLSSSGGFTVAYGSSPPPTP
ncbi:MAG TPA: G1 family glutamic endopeptidase [Verrucomicrobiae bacterium]|nr:G1 family glutamic endopeptidase [Verrucomicrobiae bacterium]